MQEKNDSSDCFFPSKKLLYRVGTANTKQTNRKNEKQAGEISIEKSNMTVQAELKQCI